jgi:hypothetical protein
VSDKKRTDYIFPGRGAGRPRPMTARQMNRLVKSWVIDAGLGLRGITVCDRWRFGENGESGYQCFLTDMGRRPSPKYLIDRINNDGNFEPGNCRWSTRAERASNQRRNALVTPT